MKKAKRETISPDLTPLIDVVFILLIFFIVSSVFKKEQLALILNLPSSNAHVLEVKPKDISIEVGQKQLAYSGQKIEFSKLDEKLSFIKEKKKNIIIRIDRDVKYHKIVKVLDILKKYELNNISLVTNKEK